MNRAHALRGRPADSDGDCRTGMRTDDLLLAANSCGLHRLTEHIKDDQEELQFAANGRLEPEIEGSAYTLFVAGRHALTTTRARVAHARRLYSGEGYDAMRACSTAAEDGVLSSSKSGVCRDSTCKL